jgi:hypothetical protein
MTAFLRPELNLIRKKDIHTRKELWKQKIKLLDLKKFDKDFWDKSYEFLPLPKTYQRIRDKVKTWLDKNKEAESKFLELQKKVGEELVKLAQVASGQRDEEGEFIEMPEARMVVDNEGEIREVQRKIREWLEELKESAENERVRGVVQAGLRLGRDNLRGFKKVPVALKRVSSEIDVSQLEEYLSEWERLMTESLFENEASPQPDLARLKELKKGAIALQRNNWEQLERQNNEGIKSEEITDLINEWKEIKDDLREPGYILWHENNCLTFMWWNEKGVDLGLEKYGFLYRNKLYFVSNFVYVDNAKLYVRVEAKVDLVYLYYGNFLRGSGTIKLKRAPLFLEDLENPLAESNKLHYPFCDDKGNLAIEEVNTIKNPGWWSLNCPPLF